MNWSRLALIGPLFAFRALALNSCYLHEVGGRGFVNRCEEPKLNATVGSSFPSFSDAFNINPASIPVIETPLGAEVIASSNNENVTGSRFNYALIRGFQSFGSALSTNSDNTFFGNNSPNAVNIGAFDDSVVPTVNFGLAKAIFSEGLAGILPTAGLSLHYNAGRQSYGAALGAALNHPFFSLGGSFSQDPSSDSWASERKLNASLGLNLGPFHFDGVYLKSDAGGYYYNTLLGSASLKLDWLVGTFGAKRFASGTGSYVRYPNQTVMLYAIQAQFFGRVQIGYLYNYLPFAHSLGLQVMLF